MEELEIILEVEKEKEQEISILEEEIKEIKPDYEQLQITPSIEEQIFKGSFDKVTVEAIEDLTEEITNQGELITEQETKIDDILEALNNKAGLNIKLQEKTVMPNTEEQEIIPDENYTGLSKVVVAGDENLVAENIKEGTSIFGVEGNVKSTNIRITDASYLFYGGARFDYFDGLLKSCTSVTSAKSMFQNCYELTTLDLSSFDTSNVTTMDGMFYNCNELTTLNLSGFDTSNVTSFVTMFSGCPKLLELDVSSFDTSNATDMRSMFYRCTALTTLDLSGFDASKVINISTMFQICSNLIDLSFMTNLGKGYTQKSANYSNYKLDISQNTKLTHDSVMSVINNLYDLNLTYDVANGGTLYTQQLVLGSTNKAKLTADEIAIATNKGWTVS